MDFLDITDYAVEEELDGSSQAAQECRGMVVHSLFGGQQQDAQVGSRQGSLVPSSTPVCITCMLLSSCLRGGYLAQGASITHAGMHGSGGGSSAQQKPPADTEGMQ